MISLALSMICGMGCSMVYKSIGNKDVNGDSIMVINYITGAIITFFLCIYNGIFNEIHQCGKFNIVSEMIKSTYDDVTVEGSISWCIVIGVLHGLIFVLNLLAIRYNIKKSGASLGAMFSSIGNMIPVITSIILFRELPGHYQWIGIVLAFIAVILANMKWGRGTVRNFQPVLFVETFLGGVMGTNNKLFQMYTFSRYKSLLLMIIFIVALFVSLYAFRKHKLVFRIREIICGIIMGIPNTFGSFFLINALKEIPATIVYPINSAGKIVLTFIVCAVIFKEKLKKQELVAIVLTVIGTILVNLN